MAACSWHRRIHAVEAGKRFVEEAVAGVDEVVDRLIFVEEMTHQHAGLGLHCVFEAIPIIGAEGVTIWGQVAEAVQVEPTVEEAVDKSLRVGTGQESARF